MLTPYEEQIEECWRTLSPHQREHLMRSLKLLAQAVGAKMGEERLHIYAKRLSPYATTKALYAAFSSLSEGERMPSVRQIRAEMGQRAELQPAKSIPPLTDEEQRRSDQSAVMSMLWLHYEKGWGPSAFRGTIFQKRLGMDTAGALALAKEIYDRETIAKWMQDQEAKAEREDAEYNRRAGR